MTFRRKIAFIDLGRRTVESQSIPRQWRQKFLGGRGMGNFLLVKHALSDCDPLGPDNVLVISAGPAAGTPLAPVAATYLTTRSALTGRITCASLDGMLASAMRWAGFDQMVIKGRSEDPVWLDVCDDTITLQDARALWASGIEHTRSRLRNAVGEHDLPCLIIGPAAEKRVRFATVTTDTGACAGRTGIGAVLGAKRVKAVAVRGGLDIAVRHPHSLLEESRRFLASALSDTDCRSASGASENAAYALCELSPSRCSGRRILKKSERVKQTLDLGLDLMTTEVMLAWVDRLIERGLLRRDTADALPANTEGFKVWIRRIAYRERIGDILAEGPVRAASVLGGDSLALFEPVIGLLKSFTEDAHDPLVSLRPAPMKPPRIEAENNRRHWIQTEGASDYQGALGRVSRWELDRMIWDCVGVCPAARPGRSGSCDGLMEFLHHLTGTVYSVEDLEAIAYRSVAIERLFDRPPMGDNAFAPLPLDALGALRLFESEWMQLGLDECRRRLAADWSERDWDRQSIEDRNNWIHVGLEDLWPAGAKKE